MAFKRIGSKGNGKASAARGGGRKFEQVESGGEIVKFERPGDSIEGTFKGTRTVKVGKGRDRREANIHDLKTDEGKLYSFWGTGYLDPRMANVEKGDYVRITYKEDEDIGQDSPMRVFAVEVARN